MMPDPNVNIESQVAEWRTYVANAPAVGGHDVDELETHLRDQIADLTASGLSPDEAFLVGVKRMGALDRLSREFARENSGRLWKQLVLSDSDQTTRAMNGWFSALVFALLAGAAVQIARLSGGFPDDDPAWLTRNLGLLVLPFLAGYFAHRRKLSARQWVIAAVPFAFAALMVNLYPFTLDSPTEVLVILHLPIALWFVVALPYMGGMWKASERRMDFVRFTGEWIIYYTLIAIGGGILTGLTAAIFDPVNSDLTESVLNWMLPIGAAGAVIVAAWLVEAKQRVVENMAPVLTIVFTPLFALMLTVAAATYAVTGVTSDFDRDLLIVFDVLLIVVLGLVLYGLSAREPLKPAGWTDRIQLLAVVSALVLDLLVLGSMVVRIGEFGFTAHRVAALGINLILLVNLAGAAWLAMRFIAGRIAIQPLERWQTGYLPVYAAWTVIVVVVFPLVFGFD